MSLKERLMLERLEGDNLLARQNWLERREADATSECESVLSVDEEEVDHD